jgi:hypothetical protein
VEPHALAGDGHLVPRQLLVVQLHACGGALARIGQLVELSEPDVEVLLQRAAAVLGRSSVRGAVEAAKRAPSNTRAVTPARPPDLSTK